MKAWMDGGDALWAGAGQRRARDRHPAGAVGSKATNDAPRARAPDGNGGEMNGPVPTPRCAVDRDCVLVVLL
jgi:hypothetical protein